MAKVIGNIKIKGTLDDLVFYEGQDGENLLRTKGKSSLSSAEFYSNPIYQRIRDHGKEFGQAAKLSRTFRALVHAFNEKAKDQSYPGRVNQLLLEIIKEDLVHPVGQRTLAQGIQEEEVASYLLGFEGNKLRPLDKVLLAPWQWNVAACQVEVPEFDPLVHIDWPANASHVELCAGRTNWDFESTHFVTHYSETFTFEKISEVVDLQLAVAEPEASGLSFLYFYIGFSEKQRKKMKPLKRIHNTVSLCKVYE
ncbi:hypothetical protein ACFX5E_14465 [Flavobacterium sp. LS2P90]|uniref:Uncharacterized protein n=1 Tax=Flavobacterium xylosi TaxID=3230415 RepID=A0ABW6I0F0_9FLAO